MFFVVQFATEKKNPKIYRFLISLIGQSNKSWPVRTMEIQQLKE